jgi:16S rRNA processing protein RimM
VVGLVRGVHGLNGALRVEVLTDHPESRFARDATLFREGSDAPLTVTDAIAIPDGPGWRIRLSEVADRDAAGAYRGVYLEADVAPDDEPGRGVYYWHEVVGVPVRGIDGEELGTVVDVYRVAENDVYVVRGGPRGEFDVPAIRDFIRLFAPRRGQIVVDAQALELGPPRAPRPPRPPRPRKGELRPTRPAAASSTDATGDVPPAEPATLTESGPNAEPGSESP